MYPIVGMDLLSICEVCNDTHKRNGDVYNENEEHHSCITILLKLSIVVYGYCIFLKSSKSQLQSLAQNWGSAEHILLIHLFILTKKLCA